MQKWEYMEIDIKQHTNQHQLALAGKQGWELVAANKYRIYLKRPLIESSHDKKEWDETGMSHFFEVV